MYQSLQWINLGSCNNLNSCTPDKEIRGFSLGQKFCSYPGVLTQANYINALQYSIQMLMNYFR